EPARGRKPVLRDELAAVVVKQQYPPERLRGILEIALLFLRFRSVVDKIFDPELGAINAKLFLREP
ncbi:MAG: hypothetical protein JXA30_16665, partial [Deltaproteobacteria bacterium]|nr:hypothetical protein [Deltaproteobacteria bacterium]